MVMMGQEFVNEYFLEKYFREYEKNAFSYDEMKEKLEAIGYTVYNASMKEGQAPLIGYTGFGESGILFSLLPEDYSILETRARRYDRFHSLIVLRDTYKDVWNWIKDKWSKL